MDNTFRDYIFCQDCGEISHISNIIESGEDDICPVCGSTDITEACVKVVRNGEVTKKTVKTKKAKLSPAQKAALAKARKKAHTGSAEKSRAKSMKKRATSGLSEEDFEDDYDVEEDLIACPDCGFVGSVEDFETEDGYFCPECGVELDPSIFEACKAKSGKKKGKKCSGKGCSDTAIQESYIETLDSIGAPDLVYTLLEKGNYKLVDNYIARSM